MERFQKPHCYKAGGSLRQLDNPPAPADTRPEIEPWLTALLQAEHLSLLVGNGLTTAVAAVVGAGPVAMNATAIDAPGRELVDEFAKKSAAEMGRGEPNVEDQIRAANQLLVGLRILKDGRVDAWQKALDVLLTNVLVSALSVEGQIHQKVVEGRETGATARALLESFLLSFASRTASKDRLHIFTTNYDRIVEFGCDLAGIHTLDRFVGQITPIFRSSRLDLDVHYNPPGIRGEPRYLEGVARVSKLHGSVDWRYERGGSLVRTRLPLGAPKEHPDFPSAPGVSCVIYPNSAKDVETTEYPYAEMFRDFSAALCRPNSVLVTYGYSFGDWHLNRIVRDMFSVPSTHLLVISYGDTCGRIQRLVTEVGRDDQVSLLLGPHFGNLESLVTHYLPTPAIDLVHIRKAELLRRRSVGLDAGTEKDK